MTAEPTLWESLPIAGEIRSGALLDGRSALMLDRLRAHTAFAGAVQEYRDRSVLIATRHQLSTALALFELDGVARRVVLCTPDLSYDTLAAVAALAQADAYVTDSDSPHPQAPASIGLHSNVDVDLTTLLPSTAPRQRFCTTEWVLLTSGTSGLPKLVLHTLHSLAGALPRPATADSNVVWSTFYDIRRYGGMQMFLRAMLGGTTMVLSSAAEPIRDYMARVGAAGVTHISGTPSHWRRALMTGATRLMTPRYVRLSGEIADQAVLDGLRAAFPDAGVAHAFASTEAGVAFDVTDGQAGFPAALIGQGSGQVGMKVVDGTLRIRSARVATRYLGDSTPPIADGDGYADTGDMVELVDGRYRFMGRKGGVINVGGQKVFPEEVEAVINADPRVRMSLVRGRKSHITGAIVVADILLVTGAGAAPQGADAPNPDAPADQATIEEIKRAIAERCRRALPAYKVPAMLRIVDSLALTAAGKLERPAT